MVSKKVASNWASENLDPKYKELITFSYDIWLSDRKDLFSTPSNEKDIALTIDMIYYTYNTIAKYNSKK